MQKFKRFDFREEPRRFKWYLRPVAALIASPAIRKYKPRIQYIGGVENLNAPFFCCAIIMPFRISA